MANSLMDREPAAVTAGLMSLFAAVVTMAHAYGWIDWTPEQSGSVAAVMVIVLPVVQGMITRRYVRPVARSVPRPRPPAADTPPL